MLSDQNTHLKPEPSPTRSCDQCRKRKIKCDFLKPQCSTCDRRNKVCTYNDPVRKRGPKPKQGQDFEEETYSPEDQDIPEITYNSGTLPIPIQISYAEDSHHYNNPLYGVSPNSLSSNGFSASSFPYNSFHFSGATSPSSSLNLAFGDLSLNNSPRFVPSDNDLNGLDPLDLNNFMVQDNFSNGIPSDSLTNLAAFPSDFENSYLNQTKGPILSDSNSYHEGTIFSDSALFNQMEPHISLDRMSYPNNSLLSDSIFFNQNEGFPSADSSPVATITELETYLLSLYYQNIHPVLPIIPFETIQPQLSLVESDSSVRFLINCMCASAASSSQEPSIIKHIPTFCTLAHQIAPYVNDRSSNNFICGSNLLQSYFNITV